MDGGRSDRSGKRSKEIARSGIHKISDMLKIARRQRFSHGVNKSSSDTELAQGKSKNRKSKSKEKWPLLEGLTVDELARYRRRRIQGQPKDNLGLNVEVENEDHMSEYREAFRARSEEFLKENTWLESNKRIEDFRTKDSIGDRRISNQKGVKEQEEKHTELPIKNTKDRTSLEQMNNDKTMETEATNSKLANHTNPPKRPFLIRRGTTLKHDGELYTDTETYSSYVGYEGIRRPELLRQNTNLKLNGEANFVAEYADVFKKHNSKERSRPIKPEIHLKTGNSFFQSTEHTDSFIDSRTKKPQLTSESNKAAEEAEKKQKKLIEKKEKNKELEMLVSKLEDLKCPPLEIPEYKDAYKDFPRERPKIVKPEDEIGRADGTKISSPSPTPRFTSKIDQDPEYKSKYLDYQRDHPVYRKPPLNLRSTYIFPKHTRFGRQEPKRHDHEFTSEVRAQYIPYGHIPRVETLKMPANLRLEGNLDLEPEYKTAYCSKHENQLQNELRMHRRRDRSLSASRRKENYWINNADQFGFTNAAQDQDAFQVLHTRVHEDNVYGKPPTGGQRSSKSSQTHMQRQTQVNMPECTGVKDRSTSPTYRLHVCNVDDEPRGFRRRRLPPFQSSGRTHNPSPDCVLQNNIIRPYSPSFGKSTKQHSNGQSFVVLDNGIFDTNKNEIRRRQTDRNYNIDGTLPISRGRAKPPANWMPPWYDSTNTI
ncbi:uncharacterized protein LOC122571410 isoform X5 [Bombus pyrosoma]|uniref:uncharacterized protein LOC122571410 isoform X5 n=1 Tax=Bombus pyrosoma TaxID=396416 RepID=UPI001CB8B4D6|nr:uncharacterized protein LOC122571410 isoform X5 [Bombus pyrosoma]